MNVRLLIDGIVRQTTVLIAELSTGRGDAAVRAQVNELWNAVTAHAAQRPPFEEDLKVTFYFGQMVTGVERDDSSSEP
ncbi:MAG TPA: hypothetical protein VH142_20440 [Polyangiaceae bacterium]|jgi:hypothetical protein|nr:hypothetical protein [Polyangiaceae bacterium]